MTAQTLAVAKMRDLLKLSRYTNRWSACYSCVTSAEEWWTNSPILNEPERQLASYLNHNAEDLLLSALVQSCFISMSLLWVLIRGSALFTLCVCVHRGVCVSVSVGGLMCGDCLLSGGVCVCVSLCVCVQPSAVCLCVGEGIWMENGQAANLGFVSLQITLSYKLPIMLPYPRCPTASPSNSPLSDSEILKCRPGGGAAAHKWNKFRGTVRKKGKKMSPILGATPGRAASRVWFTSDYTADTCALQTASLNPTMSRRNWIWMPLSYWFDPVLLQSLYARMVNFQWINWSIKRHFDETRWGPAARTDRWSCITPCLRPAAAQRSKVNSAVEWVQTETQLWQRRNQKQDRTITIQRSHSTFILNDEWAKGALL